MRRCARVAAGVVLAAALTLAGCSSEGSDGGQAGARTGGTPMSGAAGGSQGDTSGPGYSEPSQVLLSTFDAAAAEPVKNGAIDVSSVAEGYAGVSATAASRLKFQVVNGDMSYNYDIPQTGEPIIVPMNMGDGAYDFRIMMNTSGSSYVELASVSQNVALESEFEPFLRPNVFCNYTADSACVTKAFELARGAENEGDVVRDIYDWMTATITYDQAKAAELSTTTGYVPDPDETLATKSGICFDYASLAAAMFRSLGIPCKIVTGYVSPDDIYHAWNLIYIDGSWVSAEISVESDTWCRIDLTFAASGGSATVGDGTGYTDRYVY